MKPCLIIAVLLLINCNTNQSGINDPVEIPDVVIDDTHEKDTTSLTFYYQTKRTVYVNRDDTTIIKTFDNKEGDEIKIVCQKGFFRLESEYGVYCTVSHYSTFGIGEYKYIHHSLGWYGK
jgi:hypothetical protein